MALQHLRSSTAHKRPNPSAMADGQLAINTETSSPGLFFKDSSGGLVKAGPVHVGATAPNVSPASGGQSGNSTGELWLDTGDVLLKTWDGSAWVGAGVGGPNSVTSAMIVDGTIVNADINASAAIGLGKLATGALPSGITVASANIVDGTIVNADISASAAIGLSKLATGALPTGITVNSNNIVDGTIVNADISASAAIAGTKVSPSFGSQNIATTGTVSSGSITSSGELSGQSLYVGSSSDATTDTKKITVESRGFAGLELLGDTGNVFGEPGGAYVLLSEDGGSISGIVGMVNIDGEDGSGNPFTGTTGNSMLIGNKSNFPLRFGTNNAVRMTITAAGNITDIGNITAAGALTVSSGGTDQPVTITTSGTGAITLDTGTGAGTINLKPGTSPVRIFDDTSTYYFSINTGSLTANRNLTLPNANVTLVSGTMVPTTGTGATGSWGISVTGNAATATLASNINRQGITSTNSNAYRVLLGPNSNTAGSSGAFVVTDVSRLFYTPSTDTLVVGTLSGTATNCSRQILSGNGMVFTGGALDTDRTITLGTPGTLTGSTTNSVSASSHTHAITVNLGVTAGTTSGPTITSSAGTNATIPTASGTASGIVTTSTQTFAGNKTFDGQCRFATGTSNFELGAPVSSFPANDTTGAGAIVYNGETRRLSMMCSGEAVLNCGRRQSTGRVAQWYYDGAIVGNISVTASATAYNTSSDYRLKENIVPLTGAIDRLNALQPCRFNFIAEPGQVFDGFIAHEAQQTVPECVTGTKDEIDEDGNPVYQGIDQSKIVPLLTAALQELVSRVEALESA